MSRSDFRGLLIVRASYRHGGDNVISGGSLEEGIQGLCTYSHPFDSGSETRRFCRALVIEIMICIAFAYSKEFTNRGGPLLIGCSYSKDAQEKLL